jgi:archaellum component FlaC
VDVLAIMSFLYLGWSIHEYIQASKELKKIKDDIKGYKKELKEINNKFNEHKQKLGILPDDSKESIKLIKEIFTLICQDYQQLDNLIKKIEESIKETKKYKEKSILGLIGSGILGITGITGGILVRNGNSIVYGISAVSNLFSAICHSSSFFKSAKIIEELGKVVNDAFEQKKKIKEEMDNILNLLNSLKGNYPKYK